MNYHTTHRGTSRLSKGALAVGFFALTAAVLAAYRTPATGYELSIYASTPLPFWAGVGLALVLSFAIAVVGTTRTARSVALFLGASAIALVAGLPILRNYYFFGAGDSLTHLGWTRNIAAGSLDIVDFLYPGTHTISVFITSATGLEFTRSMLVMVLAFVVVFLAFVPLAVRAITGDDWAALVGAVVALLLLPINNISVHIMAHPTTQAILFLPFILYLFVRYTTEPDSKASFSHFTAVGVLLGLSSIAIVLIHPQQALNVLALFGTVVFIQFLYRLFRKNHAISNHRTMYAQTALLAAAFLLWAPRHERFFQSTGGLFNAILYGTELAPAAARRGASLSQLGSSLEELFVRLFLVSAIFAAVAGVLMLGSILGRLDSAHPDANAIVKYFTVSLIPVFGLFVVFYAVSPGTQHFRYLGLMMVVVTVLSAVAIHRGLSLASGRLPSSAVGTVTGALFIVMLAMSLMTVHASPYMFQPSGQVTEGHMNGYESAFEHRAEGVYFSSFSGGGERYADAVYGRQAVGTMSLFGSSDYVRPPKDLSEQGLVSYYPQDRYLVVTDKDVKREAELYQGLSYSREDFQSVGTEPGVSRVQTNGGFDLYLVDAAGDL